MPATEAAARKLTRRHGTCRLVLLLNGTEYTVTPVRDNRGNLLSFKLRKPDGTTHIVDAYRHCTCEDYKFTQRWSGGKCKHVAALEACGLLPS